MVHPKRQENPIPTPDSATQPHQATSSREIMAFQRADPFFLLGMTWENIPNRPLMVRAIANSCPLPRNENVAIAMITPLPGNALNFQVVGEVLREFLVDQERVPLVDIQPCHLG